MSFHRAYYSIIQFCPDRGRAEVANIGVLMLCPDLQFVDARMSKRNHRVAKFFGSGSFDAKRLELVKHAFAERIRSKFDWSGGLADLERFIATRSNDVQLTPARSMNTSNPAEDLDALFAELVGEQPTTAKTLAVVLEPEPEAFVRLDAGLKALPAQSRIRFGEIVEIPVLGKKLEVPYVYDNGARNLVKPIQFMAGADKATRDATDLAVEGQLLRKHPAEREQQLVVLPAFGGSSQSAEKKIVTLFEDFGVRVVDQGGVEQFLAEVKDTAH